MNGAVFSPDRVYRYRLDRTINILNPRHLAFVLLNPSTADETRDDPTIRRCLAYARDWDFGKLTIVNLFAYRATDPREIYKVQFPASAWPGHEGPTENDEHILQVAHEADVVVVAWGNHGAYRARSSDVGAMLKSAGIPTFALAVTGAGEPGHPLYLRANLKPSVYPRPAVAPERHEG